MTWFRSRLLLATITALLIASITPVVVLGVVVLRSYQERGQETIRTSTSLLDERSMNDLKTRAVSTANTLTAFLKGRESDLKTLAALPRTQDAYLAFARGESAEIWTIDPYSGQEVRLPLALYREIAFIDASGHETIKLVNECTR